MGGSFIAVTYVPLHVHSSEGSILDSIIKTDELIDRAEELLMPAVAMTDHGSMAAAVKHYQNCREKGIKPIIGLEAYMTDVLTVKDTSSKYFHLLLLAKNNTGYFNLKKLSSIGYIDGFYRKPRIDFQTLSKYSEGIICCSACLAGELPKLITEDADQDAIINLIVKYQKLFGKDYYLEIQSSENPDQIKVNKKLVKLGSELGIDVVVTTDVHFLNKKDFAAHNTFINISQDRDTENYQYCYLQTYTEIYDILTKQIGESAAIRCLENTKVVANKCDVEIELGNSYLPHIELPDGFNSEYDWMVFLVKEGLKEKGIMKLPNKDQYFQRIKDELYVIKTKDFQGYFLILRDLIMEARRNGIPIGPGRGSAGNCIVAYLMGITQVDSIKYNLDFSRFLTIERKDLCDIDVDVSTSRRQEFIDLITQKYGEETVAQVATFGTLASKAVLDAVGKVMEVPKDNIEMLKKKVDESKGVRSLMVKGKDYYEKNKDFLIMCSKLENLPRSMGCHAGALCIAGNNQPMTHYAPVMRNKDGNIMTQYEMHNVQDVGLVKYDMLGLSNLDVIADCLESIGSSYYEFAYPDDDPETYEMLSRGDTVGVFQAESAFMTNVIRKIKPKDLNELAACIAIGRPDTIKYLDPFANRKFGREKITYVHNELSEVLKDTYGCIIYQEQILSIVKHYGGFSDGEADTFRRALGKKIPELVKEQSEKFKSRALEKGYDDKTVEDLYQLLVDNGDYSFNAGHATAYAMISYWTAYLKCHYPLKFMSAVLNNQKKESGQTDYDGVAKYISAIRETGILITVPDINVSGMWFTPDIKENRIAYGLGLVKGLSQKGIDKIFQERPFSTFKDYIDRVGMDTSKSDTISLIKSGAFSQMISQNKVQQFKYFYKVRFDQKKEEPKPIQKINKNHIKYLLDNGLITPRNQTNKEKCIEIMNAHRRILGWKQFKEKYMGGTELDWEMQTLNAFITGDPFEGVILPDWSKIPISGYGVFGGVISLVNPTIIKKGKNKGKKMGFINVDTVHGTIDTVVFFDAWSQYVDLLKVGNCVVVTGEKTEELNCTLKRIERLPDYLRRTEDIQR